MYYCAYGIFGYVFFFCLVRKELLLAAREIPAQCLGFKEKPAE